MGNKNQFVWTQAGGYGAVPAGAELGEGTTAGEIGRLPGYRELTQAEVVALGLEPGIELDTHFPRGDIDYPGVGVGAGFDPLGWLEEQLEPPEVSPQVAAITAQLRAGEISESEAAKLQVEAGAPVMYGAVPLAGTVGLAGLLGGVAIRSMGGLLAWIAKSPWYVKIIGAVGISTLIGQLTKTGEVTETDLMKLIDKRGKPRRYTISSNPRVRTLQRVSRHCQRLLKRHEKVIREFIPRPRGRQVPITSQYLSAVERKALK